MNRKSSKAFTLIELMIIVAILGIMTSIFLEGYAEYKAAHSNDSRPTVNYITK